MPCNPAIKRYNRRILWLSLAYGFALLSVSYGFKHHFLIGPAAWVAAILPALPIVGIFVVIGRYLVEEQDEYLRSLRIRQTLWASGFALSIATIWGFLEAFGLVRHLEAYFFAVLWFAGLILGAGINKLTIGRDA